MIIQARHVFHSATTGPDRIYSWMEASGEPSFVFGSDSEQANGFLFHSIKRDFRNWLNKTSECSMTVYHDGMGSDALGPLDVCQHKVLFAHNWFPRWERNFEWMIRSTGKVVAENDLLAVQIKKCFPWVPDKYVYSVNPPLLSDSLGKNEQTAGNQRTGIWLYGQNWSRYGNRLRRIIDSWQSQSGELEIIASGRKRPAWAKGQYIKWSENLPLEFALLRLYTWDSTLLLNDYSLQAPWLVRAMKLGIFPLVPNGNSVSRTSIWRKESAPRPYEWGDMTSAMQLLSDWRQRKQVVHPLFNEWLQGLLDTEESRDFREDWDRVKEKITNQRAPVLRRRKSVSGWIPLRWYEKVQRLRSGL